MSGFRLSLAVPGAASAELLELAPLAEHWSIGGLWIGDPRAAAPNRSDSYVTTVAAAVAARTRDIRLGVFLALGREKQLVRIAEDAAVVDQASGGRLELGFVAPQDGVEAWTDGVARLLRSWQAWEVPSTGEVVPVIPGPAQPFLPRLVVGNDAVADALDAGRMVFHATPPPQRLVPRRTVLACDAEFERDGAHAWLGSGAVERVTELRERARAAGAQEILLVVRGFSERDVKTLGTALVPGLRAADRDVRHVVTDAWSWLTAKAGLHEPPV